MISGTQHSGQTLQSVTFNISSTHLAPYIIITMLLTTSIFPMLWFILCDYFVTTSLYISIPSLFSPILLTPFPLATISLKQSAYVFRQIFNAAENKQKQQKSIDLLCFPKAVKSIYFFHWTYRKKRKKKRDKKKNN